MTFIASVIAKDGVAIIADSLVTASERVITAKAFVDYTKAITKNPPKNPADMLQEIAGLFQRQKSYTKDYEEKLIEYDKYTCVTFTGAATINNIKIGTLVHNLIERNKKNRKSYNRKRIKTKVKNFTEFIKEEVKKHLRQFESIGDITFIITHFDNKRKETRIYKIDVKSSDKNALKNGTEFVSYKEARKWEKVVTDGQNKLSDAILFGHLNSFAIVSRNIAPIIVNNIVHELNIDQNKITDKLIKKVSYIADIPAEIFSEVKFHKLELSLQQATDLAALLMRVEIDFQKYIEDIPSVGGVIKLATINEGGVNFHSGHEIIKPRNI